MSGRGEGEGEGERGGKDDAKVKVRGSSNQLVFGQVIIFSSNDLK